MSNANLRRLSVDSFCMAAVVALATPQIAMAQSAVGKPNEATVADSDGEIIVTAQRRQEKLIDVPISVTAMSGAALEKSGTTDMRDLTFVTPGLNFQAFGNSAQPNIRGIGSTSSSVGDGSNVPIYVDGVYQPYQGSNYVKFNSVERIEVLKGPQGTLYGRNAAGGAIVIKTKDPSFTTEGKLGASYARFNDFQGDLYLSAPIIADRLAFNVSAQVIDSGGFRRDINLNETLGFTRYHAFRGKLLFDSGSKVTVLLSAHYQNGNDLKGFGNQPYQGNTAVRRSNPSLLIADEKIPPPFPSYPRTGSNSGVVV
jgi:iron complex outermembrane recepter protein